MSFEKLFYFRQVNILMRSMKLSNLRGLFRDDKAVSPVIGVILMVAITVILAAVIGTFVLGLGDDVTEATAPTADFDFDTDSDGAVTITHSGGDSIDANELETSGVSITDDWSDEHDTVSAGDSVTTDDGQGDETVQVVWNADGADSSQVLAEYDVPSDD